MLSNPEELLYNTIMAILYRAWPSLTIMKESFVMTEFRGDFFQT